MQRQCHGIPGGFLSIIYKNRFIKISSSEHHIWQAKKGHGSFLTLDMGRKTVNKRRDGTEFFAGEFHLWIYMCNWTLSFNDNPYLSSESIDDASSSLLAKVEGGTLTSIEANADTVLITLSNGFKFELTSASKEDSDDDYFILYTPSSRVSFNKVRGLYAET